MKALTPKAVAALRLLEGTSYRDTRSAKALAELLWPDRLKDCRTSLRRGGLYRAAGAYYSKLQKKGLVGHWMTDYDSGYYITPAGVAALTSNVKVQRDSGSIIAGGSAGTTGCASKVAE